MSSGKTPGLVQEMNLRRMSEGLQLYQHLLQEVKEKVDCSGELTALLAEISELNTHINKVGLLSGLVCCSPACFTADTLHYRRL